MHTFPTPCLAKTWAWVGACCAGVLLISIVACSRSLTRRQKRRRSSRTGRGRGRYDGFGIFQVSFKFWVSWGRSTSALSCSKKLSIPLVSRSVSLTCQAFLVTMMQSSTEFGFLREPMLRS